MAQYPRVPTGNNKQYTLDSQIAAGASSLTLNQSVAGIVRAPGYLVIDRIDSSGNVTATKREYKYFTGVSGANLTGLTNSDGTDQVHAVGAIVEFVPNVGDENDKYDVFTTEHTDLGQHASLPSLSYARVGNLIGLSQASLTALNIRNLFSASGASVQGIFPSGASGAVLTSWGNTLAPVYTTPTSSILSTSQYAPQGFLINGKIVPSVASNNLTVAIKGMDGNDPSSSNPVYCRIGDTVRTITSALSVTKNAGTNWFDAGSAELATKEIDYFVYLGYNATDGVVIGFARIPGATRYDDFSTTTTNKKYCAISTITNAAAADYYENIGRFAATLSAGAGYTWTVPTFTAKNLIQRPIYETRWLSWTPAYGSDGSMGFSVDNLYSSIYKIEYSTLYLHIWFAGTTSGSAASGLYFTSPFNRLLTSNYQTVFISKVSDTTNQFGYCQFNNTANNLYTYKTSDAAWGIGANKGVLGSGFYEI